ncbi:hypothetical protein [Tetragenococcus halophilus]
MDENLRVNQQTLNIASICQPSTGTSSGLQGKNQMTKPTTTGIIK